LQATDLGLLSSPQDESSDWTTSTLAESRLKCPSSTPLRWRGDDACALVLGKPLRLSFASPELAVGGTKPIIFLRHRALFVKAAQHESRNTYWTVAEDSYQVCDANRQRCHRRQNVPSFSRNLERHRRELDATSRRAASLATVP
jgi:hypothetical protein